MNATLDEALQLFGAGNRDRTSFLLLVESGRAPHETVGFLAQQACEKFLKAVLAYRGISPERTHGHEYTVEMATKTGIRAALLQDTTSGRGAALQTWRKLF